MKDSYYGIKFVWHNWRQDSLRTQRITFNSNNNVYHENNIPIDSKMLVYVFGINQIQGMYEVTGSYRNSGDPHFNIEISVNLVCDKINGLTVSEIKKHLRSFNPTRGTSYLPLKKSLFDSLYYDLQKK